MPSGQTYFYPELRVTPQRELELARKNFFKAARYTDPAGNSNTVDLDAHDLLPIKKVDELGNKSQIQNDYRVSGLFLITNANDNRTQCAFDKFANMVGTAAIRKNSKALGDILDSFRATIIGEEINQFFEDPKDDVAAPLLANPTSRVIYHPCWY